MKVHLRLTEKDVDLCRWRHSLKRGMITFYIAQILLSEIRGEIAYLPTAFRVSAKSDPCEVYMNFTDPQIIEYLSSFPAFRRNATLKRLIRKHLQAQSGRTEKAVLYQEEAEPKIRKAPPSKEAQKNVHKPEKPVKEEPKREIVESEEDRAAILALIAMGGE